MFTFPTFLGAASSATDLAQVLLALLVIYIASKAGGEVAVRLNLPAVLGELVFGVIVGVSGLRWIGGASEFLTLLSELGVIILLFEIGLESDLKELLRVGPQAVVVAIVGVVAPFGLGTLGLIMFFGVGTIPAVFAGAALTATSIGITARVLSDLQRITSTEGQIIVGAAVVDDILGLIILAVVSGLASRGQVDALKIGIIIISAVGFLVAAIVIGRWAAPYFVQVVNLLKTRGDLLIASLLFAFGLAYIATVIGSEAILGAFAAGLVLAETDKKDSLEEQLKPVADVFVPVFFVLVGAKTDLRVLNPFEPTNREALIIAAFLIVVAVVGKVVTGLAVFGQPVNRWAIGCGMIPRGEVGLIFAAVGTTSGVLSPALDASLIVMVIVTTFLAPPLLRWAFR